MKAYKVCTEWNGRYFSVARGSLPGELGLPALEYSFEDTTYPRPAYGPLGAFRTFEDACRFFMSGGKAIFEAEVVESTKKGFWDTVSKLTPDVVPEGTIFCDSIKLLRRVK